MQLLHTHNAVSSCVSYCDYLDSLSDVQGVPCHRSKSLVLTNLKMYRKLLLQATSIIIRGVLYCEMVFHSVLSVLPNWCSRHFICFAFRFPILLCFSIQPLMHHYHTQQQVCSVTLKLENSRLFFLWDLRREKAGQGRGKWHKWAGNDVFFFKCCKQNFKKATFPPCFLSPGIHDNISDYDKISPFHLLIGHIIL